MYKFLICEQFRIASKNAFQLFGSFNFLFEPFLFFIIFFGLLFVTSNSTQTTHLKNYIYRTNTTKPGGAYTCVACHFTIKNEDQVCRQGGAGVNWYRNGKLHQALSQRMCKVLFASAEANYSWVCRTGFNTTWNCANSTTLTQVELNPNRHPISYFYERVVVWHFYKFCG